MKKKEIKTLPYDESDFSQNDSGYLSDFFASDFGSSPIESHAAAKAVRTGEKATFKDVICRILLCIGTFIVYVLIAVIALGNMLANGPSETIRNNLVLSARQASATKWIPQLFIGKAKVEQIERDSKTVTYDVVSVDDITPASDAENEWANAVDDIQLITITKPTFKAYMLIVKDPSRIFVGTASDFKSGKHGAVIFDIAEKYNAVCAINGGEFSDPKGGGLGDTPIGVTYSQGECVWNSGGFNLTFMGFDKDNKLVVTEGMTKAQATSLNIRDGVCFQKGNTLITNDGKNVTVHYANGDTGVAQRTSIGQRADGAVLLLVTDGRTASSVGATHNDLIDIMLEYGAVTAGNLDGGSSSMMYYRDYFNIYNYDISTLDEYQRLGIVNKYRAFCAPRKIPTYFVVGASK